jgi:hypothetical protein
MKSVNKFLFFLHKKSFFKDSLTHKIISAWRLTQLETINYVTSLPSKLDKPIDVTSQKAD